MTNSPNDQVGRIAWVDLTVPDAESLSGFYQSVMGWSRSELSMGDYDDYCMNEPRGGETVAGVCHARGPNADLPPAWLVYINVADLDASLQACRAGGGAVVAGPKPMGAGRYAVIRDPQGAVCAIVEATYDMLSRNQGFRRGQGKPNDA